MGRRGRCPDTAFSHSPTIGIKMLIQLLQFTMIVVTAAALAMLIVEVRSSSWEKVLRSTIFWFVAAIYSLLVAVLVLRWQ